MHWEWIVPVIALALWILSSLVRGVEEQQRAGRQPGSRPVDRPPSEVDKFLEEINRMRRRSAQPSPEQARPQPATRTAPMPEVLPADRSPPPLAEPIPSPPAMFEPPKPKPRPVQPRREKPRTAVAKPVPPRPVPPPVPVPEAPAPSKVVAQVRRPAPAVAQLWTLLKSPATLQAAILLQEVLGPPRCRRRR
jgi:hypothetical protein